MIIRNCPACQIEPSCCTEWHLKNGEWKDCENINDCLLKRIVEKCKSTDCGALVENTKCGNFDFDGVCCEIATKKDILQMLDIQEVE